MVHQQSWEWVALQEFCADALLGEGKPIRNVERCSLCGSAGQNHLFRGKLAGGVDCSVSVGVGDVDCIAGLGSVGCSVVADDVENSV